MNILLTSGARRIDFVNFFRDELTKAGKKGKVIVADPDPNAPSLQAADEGYVIPHQTDSRYIEAVDNLCREQEIDCLVPLNDWEVPKIAAHKRELEKQGVAVFAPDPNIVQKVRDKGKYRELLGSMGIKAPLSYFTVESAEEALKKEEVRFPLIVKPRNGSASVGIEIVDSVEDMAFAYKHAIKTIKETPLDDATSKEAEENVIIQEVIEGEKYSLDMFNDLNGRFVTSLTLKQLEMRGGDVDKCISVRIPELLDMGRKMGEGLKHVGYMNADVFYDGTDYYVIDINPRFGGSYAFSHAAGANIPAAYIAMTAGEALKAEWLTDEPDIELARHDTVVSIHKEKVKDALLSPARHS
ncbi:ATP-grasp domain-containing protein [Bacillus piscicola]|uniref:ATP-grasp domain-containing protein n=1 Tax=Bacillus piscicola TaxID=1632684 RepID=UPI001F096994|nr:ATP-grasp domain-containing protein [Bacillus piscicola]